MEGANLEDKYGILDGSGAKARTITVAIAEDIPGKGIIYLVNQAWSQGM